MKNPFNINYQLICLALKLTISKFENNCNSDPEYFLLRPEVEKAYGYSMQ